MPSRQALPTVAQLVAAWHKGIQGTRLATEDGTTGSIYDCWAGPCAILWSRQTQRDRDHFRALYDDTAKGGDLSNRLLLKYQIPRILDSYGAGSALLVRPTAAAGQGEIWPGTRILAQNVAGTGSGFYAVTGPSTGIAVAASQTSVVVPIRATTYGAGVAVQTSSARIADPLFDNSFAVASLTCGDGTLFEKSKDYLARVRATLSSSRVGFQLAMVTACQQAGASAGVVFSSNFSNADYGVSAAYVADAGFSSPPALVTACHVALESWRVIGCDLLVGGMVSQPLSVQATCALSDDPSNFDLEGLTIAMQNACAQEFASSSSGFDFSRDAMAGAMGSVAGGAAQTFDFASPNFDATVLTTVNGNPNVFPNQLTRYTLRPGDVQITFTGPT